ncbi:hypothetical protein [Burkholderia ubonensis]|uniref:hypothetical protein n=1 Tax=Burkholderia ubonensis TaxID=101571 RepID=UPI000A81E782|nr:hypothetical protein [Burkholderia ubonensis]
MRDVAGRESETKRLFSFRELAKFIGCREYLLRQFLVPTYLSDDAEPVPKRRYEKSGMFEVHKGVNRATGREMVYTFATDIGANHIAGKFAEWVCQQPSEITC